MMATELKAGRELDALIADKVMGWSRDDQYGAAFVDDCGNRLWLEPSRGFEAQYDPHPVMPHFSTDIAAAWTVLERMIGHYQFSGTVAQSDQFDDGPVEDRPLYPCQWTCIVGFHHRPISTGHADTAPLAICCAAFNAMAS